MGSDHGGDAALLPIVLREPHCHLCGQKTFVIFENSPWCQRCYLSEVATRDARQAVAGGG